MEKERAGCELEIQKYSHTKRQQVNSFPNRAEGNFVEKVISLDLKRRPHIPSQGLNYRSKSPIARYRAGNIKNQLGQTCSCNSSMNCCSKHQTCMGMIQSQNAQKPIKEQKLELAVSDNWISAQEPELIDVHPVPQPFLNHPQIDHIIGLSIHKHAQKARNQIAKVQQQSRKKQQALHTLAKNTKQALTKTKKKKFSEPPNYWGHTVFEQQKKQLERQKQLKKHQQPCDITNKRDDQKLKLKPIEQRIRDYKEQSKLQLQRNNLHNGAKCCHKETNTQKMMETAQKIQERFRLITIKDKQEKQFIMQQKKLKEAKMRALQLKSLQSLKLFKKRPVPKDGNFVFNDAIKQNQQQNKIPQQDQPQEYKERKSNQKDTKKTRKTGQYTKKTVPISQPSINREQQERKKPYNKFYFWNVPIQDSDFNQLVGEIYVQTKQQQDTATLKRAKEQSFKQEVEEYLSQKFRNRMLQQRQKVKKEIFIQKVQEKKNRTASIILTQQLITTYQIQNGRTFLERRYPIQSTPSVKFPLPSSTHMISSQPKFKFVYFILNAIVTQLKGKKIIKLVFYIYSKLFLWQDLSIKLFWRKFQKSSNFYSEDRMK